MSDCSFLVRTYGLLVGSSLIRLVYGQGGPLSRWSLGVVSCQRGPSLGVPPYSTTSNSGTNNKPPQTQSKHWGGSHKYITNLHHNP